MDAVTLALAKQYTDKKAPRKNFVLNEGIVLASFDDFANWTNSKADTGTISEDRTFTKTGSSALRLHVTTPGSYTQADKNIRINLSSTNKQASMWVYLHDAPAKYSQIDVMLYNVFTSKMFACYRATGRYHQGWNHLTIAASEWTNGSGTPSWDEDIVTVRVRVTASGGNTCRLTVDDLRIGQTWEPKIIFRFDDALRGVYDKAYPYMTANGIAGITYAISSSVGGAPYMTLLELQELYAAGWDIGNHSDTHPEFNTKTYAETYTDIKTCQDYLIQNGMRRSAKHFAVPHGQDTEFVQAVLDDLGIKTSTNSVHSSFVPTMDLHKMPAQAIVDTTPVATITGWIDAAVASGRTLVLMFHNIVDAPTTTYEYSTANFQAVVDYLVTNNLTKYVVTMSDYYEGLNREAAD